MGLFKIAFIGGGNMGRAIATAIIKNNLAAPQDVCISDVCQQRLETLQDELGVHISTNNVEAVNGMDVVVLAVKPQTLDAVMAEMTGKLPRPALLFSIVAGKKIEALAGGFSHQAVVRAMPNTPAQIGKGITVWTATQDVMPAQRLNAEAIVQVMGRGIYTGYEAYLDFATAVSGSGPAYTFLFMEEMVKAAESIGIPEELAKILVIQTVLGSAEYAKVTNKGLPDLRSDVTSPGGTTAAAINVFEENNFGGLIQKAVEAAYQRAKELSNV
ncbi:MAG: pyrroline-5-carboxylate reductase [Dehalococcoidia bacterium]|nr:pyrroline-5-carboxylate reductase [Dehalococcoidia bacterium]